MNTMPWLDAPDWSQAASLLLALGIGLMLGLERERHPERRAGLRTFALIACSGWVSALLASTHGMVWLPVAGLAAVALMLVGAYRITPRDPGTTTTAAALLCYLLAMLACLEEGGLAVLIGIVATVLLHLKTELHGLSQRLTPEELRAILQFAVLALVILPLLPDRGFGPYGALNPYHVWLMVVLIAGLGLAGYGALRLFGVEHGVPLAGLLGGLVSSTATTLVFSRQTRDGTLGAASATTAILLANLVVFVRLVALAQLLAPACMPLLAQALSAGFVPGLSIALWQWWRQRGTPPTPASVVKNPANVRSALLFGGLYAMVLLASAWLNAVAGERGLYAVAVASGITDIDPITLSSFHLFGEGKLTASVVVTVICLALAANCVFKATLAASIAHRQLGHALIPALVLMAAGLLLAALLI
ncbi:MAG TPA: MgtC/SapB family protein [Chitinolyticbacter sp.]|nr:MgtC/SapB family protein [Chitinolyticbacter sp.]